MKRWSPSEVIAVDSVNAWHGENSMKDALILGAEVYHRLAHRGGSSRNEKRAMAGIQAILNLQTSHDYFVFPLKDGQQLHLGSLDQPLDKMVKTPVHRNAGKLAVGKFLLSRPRPDDADPFRMYLETMWPAGEMNYPGDRELSGVYLPLTAKEVVEGVAVMGIQRLLKQDRFDPTNLRYHM